MSPDDVDSVGAASQAISQAMRFAPIPDAVRDEVARRYAELGEPPVAVRSSALGEDSQDATFAGQQETYLWVRGADHVCDAVRDCWVSLYSPPAICVPRAARRRRRAGDGRRGAADGRRRGLRRAVHVQPRQRRPEHGRRERELGPRPRGGGRRGDAGRLSRQQGHARGRARARPREGRRVRAGSRRPRRGPEGGAGRSGARSRASTPRRSARSSTSRVGSSGTSARIRTSSGRSRATASSSSSSRGPVTAVQKPAGAPPATSAMALVMSAFGVSEKKS